MVDLNWQRIYFLTGSASIIVLLTGLTGNIKVGNSFSIMLASIIIFLGSLIVWVIDMSILNEENLIDSPDIYHERPKKIHKIQSNRTILFGFFVFAVFLIIALTFALTY